MNIEKLKQIENNRINARKILLNKSDTINFSHVPGFIIDSFFGKKSYKAQLIVCVFAFVNGISESQLFQLIRWIPFTKTHYKKISDLLLWLENSPNAHKYYSYNVILNQIVFCNGDLRKYGERTQKN